MAQDDRFRWHDAARLFAGGHQVIGEKIKAPRFQVIPATPTDRALALFATSLDQGQAFCVSDTPQAHRTEPPYFLTLTGGSSGSPRAVRRTQASWVASFKVNAQLFSMSPTDSVAVLGNLSHSLALYAVAEAAYLGADVHLIDHLRPAAQLDALRGASILYATPTQLRLLTRVRGAAPCTAPRVILCGGGALDPATRRAVSQLFPAATLRVFYGAAETSFITLTDPTTPEGSVGRAYPGVTLDIRDGVVWAKSPYLFDGYASDETAITSDGFVSVGEMGRLDNDGQLWLLGRQSRMVTVSDQNVFPEAAEALIGEMTNDICAVVAVPDALRGHHLVAVLGGRTDPDTAAVILTKCRAALPKGTAPRRVLFHSDLPLLASGKPDLPAITRWAGDQP